MVAGILAILAYRYISWTALKDFREDCRETYVRIMFEVFAAILILSVGYGEYHYVRSVPECVSRKLHGPSSVPA